MESENVFQALLLVLSMSEDNSPDTVLDLMPGKLRADVARLLQDLAITPGRAEILARTFPKIFKFSLDNVRPCDYS